MSSSRPDETYTLHITNKNYSSWSLRPWLLLRELSIPFTESLHPVVPGSYRQPQWKEFSPVAHVPCLHVRSPSPAGSDSESPPLVLWESLAIVEFLAEEFPEKKIYPADRAARAWARSAVAEMHASFACLRSEMGQNVGLRVRIERPSPGLEKDLERIGELWEEGLGRFGGPFLAGKEFGAVDAFFAPVVLRLRTYVGMDRYLTERGREYAGRIEGLEGVKAWVRDAVAEVWREEVHDKECEEGEDGRKVVEDLRAVAK
ncbi:hypothetical protein QBC42DRAFT_298219 [Cladorrhinum samala]|uniref:GST N-terminal domain-containing protein n=1 Tax=Cladorrhinum samala TaxID=585594 RepID=A0AAV9HIX0_9PEZI|nr:hypothetical protein QBC42DRAFT_298219 [Cladorrhinum samala]